MIKNHIVFIQYGYIIGYDKKSSLYNLDYLKVYLLLLYIKMILNKKSSIIIAISN